MAKAQTVDEHRDVYGTIAGTVVAEPPKKRVGRLDPRVEKGCEFLDRKYPGWANKINLARFNIEDGSRCVIGQVFGDYEEAWDKNLFGLSGADQSATYPERVEKKCAALGFESLKASSSDYAVLQRDWEKAIRDRQGR